jgi:aldehyde:ferredoxin oxidoreductase
MKLGGYAGKILHVDLFEEKIEKVDLELEFARKYVGGALMGCRLAYDIIKPKLDPFSPENAIIFSVGPLVGTNVPASSKSIQITKCATGTVTYGTAGGRFGCNLKQSGFDSLIIKGKAEKPVYLKILNGDVEICDARNLWGKDIFETTDLLWEKYGRNCAVVATGPAGEKLVRTTITLVDKISTWGKRGLGATFGSKNLKAIVVHGVKKIKVADTKKVKEKTALLIKRIKSDPDYEKAISLGTMVGFDNWFIIQGSSCKNWTGRFPVDEAYRLYGPEVYAKIAKKTRISDISCPVGCKDHLKLREGEFAGLDTYVSSFYGRLQNWASRCMVGNLNRVVKCQDFCNRQGLCVHSISALIDWAIDLFQRGIINKEDTGGLELRWDFETTMKLLEQAARKEGFGGLLSEGFETAIKKIGKGCEKYAIHIKGMEPLHDPRLNRLNTFDFHNVTNPRGAHSATGASAAYMVRDAPIDLFKQWAVRTGIPDDAQRRIFTSPTQFNVARLTKWAEDWWILSNSLGINCIRNRVDKHYDMDTYVELYTAVTGFESTGAELWRKGEMAFNLLKMLNVREGYDRKDDVFPDRWFEPLIVGGKEHYIEDYFGNRLTKEDCYKLLDEYYDERGWDAERGIPTKYKLMSLGLGDIV